MRAQELGSGKLVIFDIDDTLVNTDTQSQRGAVMAKSSKS
jgi:FMN phosphatase YigB (HAD superfamily)